MGDPRVSESAKQRIAAWICDFRSGRRDEVADEDSNGTDENVPEPCGGVDLDHNGRGFGIEEFFVHTEHELLVPCGVGVAGEVSAGR